MSYAKRYMKISELVNEGIPERILYEICHTPHQRIAFKYNGKGPWRIDTTLLDKEIARRATR